MLSSFLSFLKYFLQIKRDKRGRRRHELVLGLSQILISIGDEYQSLLKSNKLCCINI